MKIEVEMLAFENGKIRVVNVPDDEWNQCLSEASKLEQVFFYGQNDFQPQQICSVSVGDVARLNGKRFLCASVGWQEIGLPTDAKA